MRQLLYLLFLSILPLGALKAQQPSPYQETALRIGQKTYIIRDIPSRYTRLMQDSSNVWLKDSTQWLSVNLPHPAIYNKPYQVDAGIKIDSVLLLQVFRKKPQRLEELRQTEQPLIYSYLIDKESGRIVEVMFDLTPGSQLTLVELYMIEAGLKSIVRFNDFLFEDENDTLENIKARYFIRRHAHIEFKKVKFFDMSTL